MNLLSAYSQVSGLEFSNAKEANEFFFNEEFMEMYNSVDIDFAINYESLTGKEARYNPAKKAFDMLKGLPSTYNNSGMGLKSKLVQFKKAFEPIPMKVPVVKQVTPEVILGMFIDSLSGTTKKLAPISSYVNNRILSDEGILAIESFFAEEGTVELTLTVEVDGGSEEIGSVLLGKEHFVALLTRGLNFQDNLGVTNQYNNHQVRILKQFIASNVSEYDLPQEEVEEEVVSQEEIDALNYNYSKHTGVPVDKYDYTPSQDLTRRLLHQLKIAIEKNDFKQTNSICSLIGNYRKYIQQKFIFTKTAEASKKENADHIQRMMGI